MVQGTQVFIALTLEQLGQLIEEHSLKAFRAYVPPITEKIKDELPELATTKQVCDCLHITRTTLHYWSKDTAERSAILVPQKIGNRIFYRREDVLSAIKEHRRFKQD